MAKEIKKELKDMSIADLKEAIRGKDRDNEKKLYFHSRIADKFSVYQTMFFLKLNLNANQVSFIWIILGIISTLLLWIGNYWTNIMFYILFIIVVFIDYSDGEIARYWNWRRGKKAYTVKGLYIENFSHSIIDIFIFIGLGIGSWNAFGSILYFYAGISIAIMILFNLIFKLREYEAIIIANRLELVEKLREQKSSTSSPTAKLYNLFKPQTMFYSLFFWTLILGIVHWFLITTFILFIPLLIKNIFDIFRRLDEFDKQPK